MEYILARMLRNVHVWILETTHTCHSTKVVIKGAVLLHKEHNVLDILQTRVHAMGVVPSLDSRSRSGSS